MAIITPDNQEFKKVLQDLSSQSRLQTAESALLVKYQREISGEDNDKREKQLDTMNETLKKILDALGPKGKRKGKGGGATSSDDSEVTLRDELKFLFSGAAKIGSNIKESVKSTYFTKPTSAVPGMSSAERLEAQDAISQPSQVDIDQLKIAEDTNDTQKDILKELKKLNETTEESAQAGGSGSSIPSIDISTGPDGKGRPGGKKPSLGSRLLRGAAKVARVAGPIGAVAGAAYGAFEGAGRAGEVFGVDQDKATLGQKAASAAGGILDPFGLGYGDKAAKGIYGFFGGGKKEEVAASTSPPPPPPSAPPPASKVGGAIAATTSSAPAAAPTGDRRAAEAESSPLGALQFLKSLGILPKGQGGKDGFVGYQDDQPISRDEVAKRITAAGKDANKVLQLLSEMGAPGPKVDVSSGDFNKITGGALTGGGELAPAKSKSSVTEAVGKEQSIAKERKALRFNAAQEGRDMTPEELAKDKELASQQIAAGEGVTKARAEAAEKLSVKQIGLNAYSVVDEQGEKIAIGKTRDEAIASAKTAGASNAALSSISNENSAMRDEMTTSRGTTTPIVSNNTTNTSTNNFMPIKGDPRPNSRGSALDNHMNRVSTY